VVWDLLLLARLVSGDLPPSPDELTKAERKAQEQRIMTTKKKEREAKPMSPEARPAHRHYDYATRVQAHLAKHAAALALIQKTLAEITDPTRTYQSSEVYALINKRVERDRTFFLMRSAVSASPGRAASVV
jgi:hypothetical protein